MGINSMEAPTQPRKRGRPLGSKRKSGFDVEGILDELKCNPIKVLARVAMNPKMDTAHRIRAAAELAQYVAPKRRATEHSGSIGIVEEFLIDVDV
jgi:hypothetical protein